MERASFGSKVGIILATAGSAVGLGNVWRFPYMAGDNGGAAFIIIYIACALLLGLPCMISELIIGRHSQANTAGAYRKLAGGGIWSGVGYMGVLTGFLITGYYAVVSGWCLQYIYASAANHLNGTPELIKTYFTDFETNPWKPASWAVSFVLLTHFIVVRGVQKGIEKASKLMMPALFVILLVVVVASCMLPGAEKGISFLFNPDFSKVTGSTLLGALGQSFYSLSIGMGCLCTYASYFGRDTDLGKSAVQITIIDTCVAIMAGLMIFPAAFSVGISPDSGPSLVFITLPNVFNHAFSAVPWAGQVVSVMFYMLLALAALTTLISLHEVGTAFFQEEFHKSRNSAAWIVTLSCSAIGVLCSLSLTGYDGLQVFGTPLFDLLDFFTGQILLPVGGFLTCIFLGWFVPKNISREQFTNWGTIHTGLYGIYIFLVRFVCPVCIALVFLNQFGVI